MHGYTVIDVETTGFSPAQNDRIVEIGVVHVSTDGQIQDRWTTLINPQRDVGPTHVHGITAKHVMHAPTFAEVCPYLLSAVRGRTLAAHNAPFDLRFVLAEIARTGADLPQEPPGSLCTMQWSGAFLQSHSRKLKDCCTAAGIPLDTSHSAASDALATAQLLALYLQKAEGRPPWHETTQVASAYPWPESPGTVPELRLVQRSDVPTRSDDSWLDAIVARMPHAADVRVESYLSVLENVLDDRYLSEHEKQQLVSVATDLGLSRGQVIDLHASYLGALATLALADGVVTADERAELDSVAGALGLRSVDVEAALADAQAGDLLDALAASIQTSGLDLRAGDRVAFTGAMTRSREAWVTKAAEKSLLAGSLTKNTKVLVAADPDSASGKAARARDLGIPIVTEAAFERYLASVR